MLYSDSLREMMQNGLNESFWDGLGVEIGPCANFDTKTRFLGTGKFFPDRMLGACLNLDAKSVPEALV